jgi:beta-lactamase class C
MKIKYILIAGIITALALFIYSPPDFRTHAKTVPHQAPKKMGPSDPWVTKNMNPEIQKVLLEYGAFIKEYIKSNVAPGAAVAIIQDTSILYLKGFGLRDVITGDSVDIHTVFRIGSVSKCFASILTGLLVDEKYLGWDDPIVKYLPNFKLKTEEHTAGLTVRHVLSHTTGLPYHAFTDRVDDGANFDTLVYHLRDLDLLGKPGQLYSYQNVGYSLISDVIRSATGSSYVENLKAKIFEPLHMETASVTYEDIMKNKDVAQPHRFARKWIRYPISSTYYNVAPAGGINASISDMALWLRALVGERPLFITPASRETIFHPVVRATARNNHFWQWKPVRSAWYALGWRVLNFKDDTLLYHGGFVNGYRS